MASHRVAKKQPLMGWKGPALIAVVLSSALAWYLGRGERVELGEQGYELTLALYSVCNQEDLERMIEVEGRLQEIKMEGTESPEALEVLEGIAQMAKRGDWVGAMKSSRGVLQDQVHRKRR